MTTIPTGLIRKTQRGVTLVEAIVVVAVIAVITGASLPSLASRLSQHQVAGVANDLISAARQARSEALSRRERVVVAPVTGRDWNSGWRVFVDANNNGSLDAGETVLGQFAAPPAAVRITPYFGATFAGQYLSFDEAGYPQRAGTEGLLLGRLAISSEGHERALCVSAAVVRIKATAICS
ncbi:MAG: GspH/FimT family protein [Burkholderiaceae bacterium]